MTYTLGKIIGKGSDGIVFELVEDGKKDKVIKFIQGENFGIKNYIEYYILYNLDSNYITRALDIEIEDNGLLKIIQKRADMDLKKYILKNKLSDLEKKDILYRICKCVKYLNSKNILHGDLKPSNILIFENKDIKLSDFNLSRIITKNNKINQKLYTLNFRAPEIYENNVYLKTDIWALGCTLYEIYYGVSYLQQGIGKNFFHVKLTQESDEKNKLFNNLINGMLQKEIENRFSIDEVLENDFFKNKKIDVQFEKEKEIPTEEKFLKILEKNMKKYSIVKKKHEKIFISKILNNCNDLIDNNYRKIEKSICSKRFDFNFT